MQIGIGLGIRAGRGASFDPNLEMVSNGTFDADIAPWTVKFNGTATWSAGAMRVTADGGASSPRGAYTLSGLSVGGTYRVAASIVAQSTSINSEVYVTTASTGSTSGKVGGTPTLPTLRTETFNFTASAETLYLVANSISTVAGAWTEFDNISVKRIA